MNGSYVSISSDILDFIKDLRAGDPYVSISSDILDFIKDLRAGSIVESITSSESKELVVRGNWVYVESDDQPALLVGIRPYQRKLMHGETRASIECLILTDEEEDFYYFTTRDASDITGLFEQQYDLNARFKSGLDDFNEGRPHRHHEIKLSFEQYAQVMLKRVEVQKLWELGLDLKEIEKQINITTANEIEISILRQQMK